MTYEELVAHVGPVRYRAACELAWKDEEHWPGGLANVPHQLGELWDLDAGLRILREMPCYGVAGYLKTGYADLSRAERSRLWGAYRAALDSGPDRLSEAVEYSLWVDFLEDRSTVKEAWREMTREPTDRRLERLLEVSGPVPRKLKEPLFDRLAEDQRWEPFIRAARAAGATEYYGK